MGIPRRASCIAFLCCAIVVFAYGASLQRAKTFGMRTQVAPLVFQSIPAVLSAQVFGHDKPFTSLESVSAMYYAELSDYATDAGLINSAIQKIRNSNISRSEDPRYRLLFPDDKGIVDFVSIAFRIFGLKAQSPFDLYFLLLLLSSACFVAAFRNHPSHLLLLASFLATYYLVLPMIALNPQLYSILHSRANPLLSMVACLHCLLFAIRGRVSGAQVLLLGVQIVLIIFVLHLRTTTIWQLVSIAALSIVAAIYFYLRPIDQESVRRRNILAASLPVILLITALFGLNVYRSHAYPIEYHRGEQILTRTFWHNIFSGFAFHPRFSERYALRVDDVSIMLATVAYLHEKNRAQEWQSMGVGPPGITIKNWTAYDRVVKEMLVERCSAYLGECIAAFAYYKPVSLASNLAWLYGLRSIPPDLDLFVSRDWGDAVKTQMLDLSAGLDKRGFRAFLWAPVALLLVLPFVVLMMAEGILDLSIAFIACAVLFIGSTVPTLIGYPIPFTLSDPGIALGMLLYFSFCAAATILLKAAIQSPKQPQTAD